MIAQVRINRGATDRDRVSLRRISRRDVADRALLRIVRADIIRSRARRRCPSRSEQAERKYYARKHREKG